MIENITGLILAGGKSTRMGTNKALLPFRGKALIETVVDSMAALFSNVVLSVHEPKAYPDISIPEIVDHYPETGPMGALASVFESGKSRVFCVACDMPFLNPGLIEYMCLLADCDAVIPVWKGRIEVMHAIYGSNLLPTFQQCLQEGRWKVTDAFTEAHVRYIQEQEIKRFDGDGSSFRNLNTPDDYKAAL